MSVTSIEAHHEKWSDLPLFTHERWVVTDDDIEAWGDLLYMRGLTDSIVAVGLDVGALPTIRPLDDVALEPWPADDAAQLLEAWKAAA